MSHWARLGERGSLLGLRITAACYRILGEGAARLLLVPVVAYFFLTGGEARRASQAYLARIRARGGDVGGEPGWRHSFRHMLAFAVSGLDKLAAWMGRIDHRRVSFPQRGDFEDLVASGKGAVIIGSHLGNLEMSRALANHGRLAAVNAVVYTEHAQRFNAMLARADSAFAANLIHVGRLGPETAIMLREKVDRGELLVIVGDRTPPADRGRTSRVEFLGAPASFAQGPFILASLLECPVYLFFCLREAEGYRLYFERFAERIVLPRKEREARLQEHLQRYAQRLEAYCLKAPYQWFNFFDFWRDGATTTQHGYQGN